MDTGEKKCFLCVGTEFEGLPNSVFFTWAICGNIPPNNSLLSASRQHFEKSRGIIALGVSISWVSGHEKTAHNKQDSNMRQRSARTSCSLDTF